MFRTGPLLVPLGFEIQHLMVACPMESLEEALEPCIVRCLTFAAAVRTASVLSATIQMCC